MTHQPSEVAEGGWWTLDELAARIVAPDRAWVPDGLYVTRLLLADLVR